MDIAKVTNTSAWRLPDTGLDDLEERGFFLQENLVAPEALNRIESEIEEWRQVPAINGYGCIFHANDALLQNLGLYSRSALHLALDENILRFMEKHFGEPVLLSKCEYRRALTAKEEMPLHSDGNSDISVFVYLSGVQSALGATSVAVGSHKVGTREQEGTLQVPLSAREKHRFPMAEAEGRPGVCLVFDVNAWHLRTASIKPGREILWFAYTPVSRRSGCLELVLTRSALIGLNGYQLSALGIDQPYFKGHAAEDFRSSRQLESSSLYFLSSRFLVRTLMWRVMAAAKSRIPGSAKDLIKRLLRS